ncbi:MAG: CdaR family protein [Proteobacteria bacterium]|nr:CdaR family protein [Pseudomonadota bacterium]
MARRRRGNFRFGVLILSITIAAFLWGVAHGSSSVERAYDIPVEIRGLKDKFVVTDMSTDALNVRIGGSRAALRNLEPNDLVYDLDLTGVKRGEAEFEVDASRVEEQLPRGSRILSRSPSKVVVRVELKGRKAVSIRADIAGEPAEGFRLVGVEVDPHRVWLIGARSEVLRLNEVVTEPIDISELSETEERRVRLFLGGGTVWKEEKGPVTVHIEIEPDPDAQGAVDGEAGPGSPARKG